MTATTEPDTSPVVPTPEPPRGRPAHRLSTGHLLIALAAITAVVANYAVLRARDDTVRVVVAASEIAAGGVVDPDAVAFADVRADSALLESLFTDRNAVDGQVATATIRPGEPLRRSDLRSPAAPAAQRAMSLAVPPERAVGGRLTAGDRVDVIEVRGTEAAYLVTDAEVLHVPRTEGPAGLGAFGGFSVTLAVDDEVALRLALALQHGEVHLIRSTGSDAVAVERLGAPDADRDDGEGR